MDKEYQIAVAGIEYVGLSSALLLVQNHKVTVVDIVSEKVKCEGGYCDHL